MSKLKFPSDWHETIHTWLEYEALAMSQHNLKAARYYRKNWFDGMTESVAACSLR